MQTVLRPQALEMAMRHSWALLRPLDHSCRALASGAAEGGGGWLPEWAKSRLPGVLGGTKDLTQMEDLTLDSYASSLKQARRLGGLSGFVHGSSNGKDPTAQGTLRLYEAIIGAMQPAERADVAQFGQAERQRVAQEVGCSLAQVEDCMARYLWMRAMTSRLAQLKREGKPMPTSVGELESMLGTWQQYKADRPGQGGDRSGFAALNATGPGGVPCPLAGLQVGKNTKCTLTRKAYKACCGRGQRS